MNKLGRLLFSAWVLCFAGLSQAQDEFSADYYTNSELSGPPALSRTESDLHFRWNGGSPDASIPNDYFSARFRGALNLDAGDWIFTVRADDGVRLRLNGELLIDAWVLQPPTTYTARISLDEGEHSLEVDYFEAEGWSILEVDWRQDFSQSPLGTNISALAYYSTEWTLCDAMKSAGGWYTRNQTTWDTGEQDKLDLDERGWVRSLPASDDNDVAYRQVAALLLNGTEGRYPAGRYVVLYDGEGTLSYGFDAVKNEELSTPGRHVLDVAEPGDGGIVLIIEATDPEGIGDYIRNIRVMLPGTEGRTSAFHPDFLAGLAPYRVIRFMDFLRTNTTDVSRWQDRPLTTDARWNSERGAPIEVALDLANETAADPWINIPHRADDDYVARFAQLALERLDTDRKIYVEYGNEIWNAGFTAGDWVEEQAEARWPNAPFSGYTKRLSWYGMRTTRVIMIWKEAWGDQAHRVIGVMGGMAGNIWASEQALLAPLWRTKQRATPARVADVLAIAPYFGAYAGRGQFVITVGAWADSEEGLDNLFQELETGGLLHDPTLYPVWQRAPENGALHAAEEHILQHAALAEQFGLQLAAYEGGQHLSGVGNLIDNQAMTDLFTRANRDPRMGALYADYLKRWRDSGGVLFCHFLSVGPYNRYGSWGAKSWQNEEDSPKHEALLDFIRDNPIWWDD